jgi:cullin 1
VQTASKRSLGEEGHFMFKETIFDILNVYMREIILNELRKDRNGEIADRSLLKSAITVFIDMGMGDTDVYQSELEKYAEKETEEFYHKESEEWINKHSLTEYMVKAEMRIKEETQRLTHIFTSSSKEKLMRLCDQQLLAERQNRLLDMSGSGVEILITHEKFDDLSRLYRLMSRIDKGLEPIANMFQKHISRLGLDIFNKHQLSAQQATDHAKFVKTLLESYVPELLDFHIKMDALVTGPFQSDAVFQKALSQGFKTFVNNPFQRTNSKVEVKATQLFAFYCDEVMRKKEREERTEERMDKVVKFIQFFNDKDLFIEEYRKQLAKRLLSSSYQDSEERSVIAKLKYQYRGVGDLYKLEKMLTDKTLATDMKTDFDNYLAQKQTPLSFDLSVTVLTMGTWPITLPAAIRLPNVLTEAQERFKEFYDSRNSKRVLKWAHTKSYMQLEGHFSQDKLFEVSTYQACILLMFNDTRVLSVEQIQKETGIELEVLQRTVMSLVSKGCKLLIMESGDRELAKKLKPTPESTFRIHEDFKHKLHKIKVPSVRMTEEDTQSSQQSVSGDRIGVLEAAIVRIMKTRKILKLSHLIKEVISQVTDRFKPDPKQIKKRIESLMDRDYLKRSEDSSGNIEYLA